jgi:hypothetical protein
MLASLVSGEAMTVFRGELSCWAKLKACFDPQTPAKALVSMLAVMSPKKVKEVCYLAAAVEDSEVKVKALGADHDVTLDSKIKSAVLTAMCPEEFQNFIFQWMDNKTTYEDLRDKVVALSQGSEAQIDEGGQGGPRQGGPGGLVDVGRRRVLRQGRLGGQRERVGGGLRGQDLP